jgi:hypothetical protein
MQLDVATQVPRRRLLRHECGTSGIFGKRCDDRRGFRGLIDNGGPQPSSLSVRVD